MEHPRTGDARGAARSRTAWVALLLCAFCVPLLFCGAPSAHAAGDDTMLEGSGIRYPEGFDLNTVGDVRGTAHAVERPDRGPIRFRLDAATETYIVLASPQWYWEDLRTEIPEGAEVKVRGSKTLGRDLQLYVIAQEIRVTASGRTWAFRDDRGAPLWKSAAGGMGVGGSSGSPMLRGGAGRGPGGTGGMGGRGR